MLPTALASILASRWLNGRPRTWLLLATSVCFYVALDAAALPLMAGVVVASWLGGLIIERRRIGIVLAGVVAATLCPLLLSKYMPWLRLMLDTGQLWNAGDLDSRGVPPGLSFVTLQAIGNVVDVFRRRVTASRSLVDQALFLAFFPQLVAGPIERTEALRPQLEAPCRPSSGVYYEALKLALWGYVMKLVLADTLAGPIEQLLRLPAQEAPAGLLLALPLFSARLYLDFYAYSCIAVALGQLHGVHLTMNFAHPYGATDLGAFWRRWHISLSSWWRDYVYLPLGGRKHGMLRESVAVLIVFLLSGLWHGAGLGFVLWGVCHGVGLLVERAGQSIWGAKHPIGRSPARRLLDAAKTLGTGTFVTACWLPFLASGDRSVPVLIGRLLQAVWELAANTAQLSALVTTHAWVVVLALAGATCAHRMEQWYWRRSQSTRFWMVSDVVLTNLLVVSLLLLGDFGGRTFIYFAF